MESNIIHAYVFLLQIACFMLISVVTVESSEHEGKPKNITRCLDPSASQLPSINCANNNHILIRRAFYAKTEVTHAQFCNAPMHNNYESCTSTKNLLLMTNILRQKCNGVQYCKLPINSDVNVNNFNACIHESSYNGPTYLTVEYNCLRNPSRVVNMEQNVSLILNQGIFNMHNVGYKGWATLQRPYICTLKPSSASKIKFHVLDIWSNITSGSRTSPFCFSIITHNSEIESSVCWDQKELVFDPLSVPADYTKHPVTLAVHTQKNEPVGFRLWLQVTVSGTSSTTIQCHISSSEFPPPKPRQDFPPELPKFTVPNTNPVWAGNTMSPTAVHTTSTLVHVRNTANNIGLLIGATVGSAFLVLAVMAVVIFYIIYTRKKRNNHTPVIDEDEFRYATHINACVGKLQRSSVTFTPEYKEHVYQNQLPSIPVCNNKFGAEVTHVEPHSSQPVMIDNEIEDMADAGYARIQEVKRPQPQPITSVITNPDYIAIGTDNNDDDKITDIYAKPNKVKSRKPSDNDIEQLYAQPLKKKQQSDKPQPNRVQMLINNMYEDVG